MMSTSRDSSASFASRISALSHVRTDEEPSTLCGACHRAHDALLSDNLPANGRSQWVEVADSSGKHFLGHVFPFIYVALPADVWPGLPGLVYSSQAGCGFCSLLLKAMRSNEFKDLWYRSIRGSIVKAKRFTPINISFKYLVRHNNLLDCLLVRIGSSSLSSVFLRFQIEAVAGEWTGWLSTPRWLSDPVLDRSHVF